MLHINTKLASDKMNIRAQKRIHSNIGIFRDDATGLFSFDLSYLKENRIQGQFIQRRQGDHTTAYSAIISALEQRLSHKKPTELLELIVFNRSNPTQPTLHNDLLILFYLYAKIIGDGKHHYLREKLQNVQNAYTRLISGIYLLKYVDEEEKEFSVKGEGASQFLKLTTDYLYHYLICLQFLPFSAVYAEPGEGSGGRGEAAALQFLNKLSTYPPSESECLKFFSRLFDEKAIETLVDKLAHGTVEILAFQLMGFLSFLDGYPSTKKFFFHNQKLAVSSANLNNIATVLFCYLQKADNNPSVTEDNRTKVSQALELIAKLRSKELNYGFFL